MAKTKKAKNAAPELEAAGQAQEPEATAENQNAAPEPEAAEPVQELETTVENLNATQEPEITNAKTSPEDSAKIEASVTDIKLEMNEDGEITMAEPDIFARLPNPCVYCGPSIKGIARQYTTYQGGIPDALRDFVRTHPHALGLIVPTGKFKSMRKRLETRGTPEADLYKAVKAEL